ncbi:MAG: Ig-like domain-containing protein [Pirellulaceae bacterium]
MKSRHWSSGRKKRPRRAISRGGSVGRLVEPLESRIALDSDGFLTGADVHLTLSFAPDGTQVGDATSGLYAKFNPLTTDGQAAQWQATVLEGFQTWASLTNADVGVVADNGDPIGMGGFRQGDERFGDIRISARPLADEVGAISVPVTSVVGGTWFADVVFNTNFQFADLNQVLAIAMHEAGNVFGLVDSDDSDSPLHAGVKPSVKTPTPDDISALQSLHGTRQPDIHEPILNGQPTNNDTFADATRIKPVERVGDISGSGPSVTYGDLTTAADQDVYRIDIPGDYTGPVTVTVKSAGISLLAPRVELFNDQEQLLQSVDAADWGGGVVSVTVSNADPNHDPYLVISGATDDSRAIGGYSLMVRYDAIDQTTAADRERWTDGSLRFLSQDEIDKVIKSQSHRHLLNEDFGGNDDPDEGTELETAAGYVEDTRYEAVGSIEGGSDVDVYTIKSPDQSVVSGSVMTVDVRALDEGHLIPRVTVLDKDRNSVAARILTNGGGELIVQVTGVQSRQEYFVRVGAADANGPFATGNYEVTVSFGDVAAELTEIAGGTVSEGANGNQHTLYVARPQLFHVALAVGDVGASIRAALVATVRNSQGEMLYEFAAQAGQTRTGSEMLLNPGTYTIDMVPRALGVVTTPAMDYSLSVATISDPFLGLVEDPTNQPFQCTDPPNPGSFCYPGSITSHELYLIDNTTSSIPAPPPALTTDATTALLVGDWWAWYWGTISTAAPPTANADVVYTAINTTLALSANVGPLANDLGAPEAILTPLLESGPAHGTLVLDPDGALQYTPDAGFEGADYFSYRAYDFVHASEAATVTLVVGSTGDFNGDRFVNGADFLVWQMNFGTTNSATLSSGDGDGDGDVDLADLAAWSHAVNRAASVGSVVATSAASSDTDPVGRPPVAQTDRPVIRTSSAAVDGTAASGIASGRLRTSRLSRAASARASEVQAMFASSVDSVLADWP